MISDAMKESAYLTAISEAIGNAEAELGPRLFNQLSLPQPLQIHPEYAAAHVKVMIMGQETYGVSDKLAEANSLEEGWLVALQGRAAKGFASFDYAYSDKKTAGSAFWRGYQEVCDTFQLGSRRAAAWSNISKVQTTSAVAKNYSITQFSSEDQATILKWQKRLAVAEMDYFNPDVVILFTGSMTWMVQKTFATTPHHVASDTRRIPISDLPLNSTGQLEAPLLRGRIAGYTYHPGARINGTIKKDLRKRLIEWAVEEARLGKLN